MWTVRRIYQNTSKISKLSNYVIRLCCYYNEQFKTYSCWLLLAQETLQYNYSREDRARDTWSISIYTVQETWLKCQLYDEQTSISDRQRTVEGQRQSSNGIWFTFKSTENYFTYEKGIFQCEAAERQSWKNIMWTRASMQFQCGTKYNECNVGAGSNCRAYLTFCAAIQIKHSYFSYPNSLLHSYANSTCGEHISTYFLFIVLLLDPLTSPPPPLLSLSHPLSFSLSLSLTLSLNHP